MPKARIVVVEDEPAIRRGVVDALRLTGYDVAEAADGSAGLREASGGGVDLVLLDLLLPKKDGLKMGADDYVVKPFSARELIARVEAVLRRTLKKQNEVHEVQFGRATIDLRRREIRWSADERTDLSETEGALLKYLVMNRDRAVSREELLGRVWGIGTAGLETRAVDMHVARLRAKLKDPSGEDHPEAIVTVRAHGYMAGPGLAVTEDEA
jgi:two-component system, OmpR family, response regulator RpaB